MSSEMTTKRRQNGYILKVTENAAKWLRHAIQSFLTMISRFAVENQTNHTER